MLALASLGGNKGHSKFGMGEWVWGGVRGGRGMRYRGVERRYFVVVVGVFVHVSTVRVTLPGVGEWALHEVGRSRREGSALRARARVGRGGRLRCKSVPRCLCGRFKEGVDVGKSGQKEKERSKGPENAFLSICPGSCPRARCPLWQRAQGWCYQPGKFNPDAPPQKDKAHPPPVITRSQLRNLFLV